MKEKIERILEKQPADFIRCLTEMDACPHMVSMSEAVWNLLLKPLYERKPSPADGNRELAEILYEAATALHMAQCNGAQFEIMGEVVDGRPTSKVVLEVFMEGKETPTMEIGIAGEKDLARHPEKLEATDTPPVYFTLDTIGSRA
ncbi:hypothetical protein KL86DPRO_10482 [uncultured delta proteobacterium]|uniref:Uncharacterized protein n=1 Tax=uncultured delta proteobacterium TaxID=34034 RepID=A0A212J1R9_9DELT|nr:hypothetical protein KL86DPRO_10482 [uncultured delta proteobacterium]